MALLAPLYDIVEAVPELDQRLSGLILGEVFSARGLPGIGSRLVSHEGLSRAGLREALGLALQGEVVAETTAGTSEPEAHEPDGEQAEASGDGASVEAEAAGEAGDLEVEEAEHPDAALADLTGSVSAPEATAPEADLDGVTTEEKTEDLPDDADDENSLDDVVRVETEPTSETADRASGETVTPAEEERAESDEAERSGERPVFPPDPFSPSEASNPETPAEETGSPEPEDAHEPADLMPEPPTPEAPVPPTPLSAPPPEAAPEPLWARLARERREAAGEPEPDSDVLEEGSGTPLWKQFASGGATPEVSPSPLADSIFDREAPPATLRDAIAGTSPVPASPEEKEARVLGDGVQNREWYIEKLFLHDEEAYEHVIGLLAEAKTWTDATQIIGREVFRRYKVDIYSEPAVSFTGSIEAQMRRG